MLHQGTVATSNESRHGGGITSRFLTECHLKLVLYTTQRSLPSLYTGWKNAFFSKKNFHFKKNVYFCIWNDSRIVGQKAEDF